MLIRWRAVVVSKATEKSTNLFECDSCCAPAAAVMSTVYVLAAMAG